jgi:hypothetical protein
MIPFDLAEGQEARRMCYTEIGMQAAPIRRV